MINKTIINKILNDNINNNAPVCFGNKKKLAINSPICKYCRYQNECIDVIETQYYDKLESRLKDNS